MARSGLKTYGHKMRNNSGILCVFLVLIVFLCAGAGFGAMASTLDWQEDQGMPSLLLNSGLVESSTAVMRYTLWTEKDGIAQDLLGSLRVLNDDPGISFDWHMETLGNGSGEKAVCLWAQESVDAASEEGVWEKVDRLSQVIDQLNGKQLKSDGGAIVLYLEERVNEAVSLAEYWQKEDIILQQSSDDGRVQSWSGLGMGGLTPCESGGKLINVQLTTRKLSEGGKTVLAFPAMYNDI